MGRAIVPNHHQWSKMVRPQLLKEGYRRFRCTMPYQFHYFHLSSLQADRRVVAGLLPVPGTGGLHQRWLALEDPLATQVGVGSKVSLICEEDFGTPPLSLQPHHGTEGDECLSLLSVGLQKTLLGSLKHEAQVVQVVKATATTEPGTKALLDELSHYLPIPVSQINPCFMGRPLDCGLQLGLLVRGSLTLVGGPIPLLDQLLY